MRNKLVVKNLHMYYGDKCVLNDINFEVKEGEFLSILGPSGCGKTTLLRILIGLINPNRGIIEKDGKNITNISPSARGMGIVFQNYALFENMTVLENIEYALKIQKENRAPLAKAIMQKKVFNMLERMGLLEHKNKHPALLSGGQQQRVAIARTLIMNPDIILFDEPMSALDAATRMSLRDEIKKIQKDFGTTILYITHDQEEAFSMSDRVMIMKEASVVQIDTPTAIIQNPQNDYVKKFVLENLQYKMNSLKKYMRN